MAPGRKASLMYDDLFPAGTTGKGDIHPVLTDSQRSHLSSFTMKLMDKFHSPKIKRTPSKKGKQPDLLVKTPEKVVNKTIVDKMAIDNKVLEMLPGSASKVLEAILPLVQTDPRIQQSSAISSCYSRVYQSLGNLIRWSDQVMLEGINSEDKEVVNTELVRLTIEKQERPSPTSPAKPSLPASLSDSTPELPLTDREIEILNKTAEMAQPPDVLVDAMDDEVAPPKPPLPCIRVAENSPPPALPPKKRQSAPSPTRVAVVAPMSRTTSGSSLPIGINRQDFDSDCYVQRRLSGGSQSYGGESPRLSPYNSMGKLSKSDEQLSSLDCDSGQCSRNTSCETLDHYDPDYEFLQQDLSSADQIPPPASSGVLSPLPESSGESGSPFHGRSFQLPEHGVPSAPAGPTPEIPPALPEKKRRGTAASAFDPSACRVLLERHLSQYDNISEDELHAAAALHPAMPFTPFAAVLPFQAGNSPAPMEFLADFAAPDLAGDSEKPPPLPEKKNKHILRDMKRGRDLEQILTQYTTFVKPAFEEFCLPTKKYADVIIPRGVDNMVAINLIVQHIQDILNGDLGKWQRGPANGHGRCCSSKRPFPDQAESSLLLAPGKRSHLESSSRPH
ncbi:hypothetical protein JRQ81_008502 [Phrynocephalus forsythii]|uniref:Phosphoribulokinase/uridine kinase domain-containing protein n=1 Tax=Phrynocephalus forsythii TaxID=171643 RepID=A0A9Q1ASE1_9SAUR|nr:hypothetical protein JRQ81_008502 [Phrynocephalus forsythii]